MMNGKLKKAPHFDAQSNAPQDELIILCGTQAWNAYGTKAAKNTGKSEEWLLLAQALGIKPTEKPVILGGAQLDEINVLRIAPEGKQCARLCQFGNLSQEQLGGIVANLARYSDVEILTLCDNLGEMKENLTDWLKRMRGEIARGEPTVEQIIQASKATINLELDANVLDKAKASEKTEYFMNWLNYDIAFSREDDNIYQYNGTFWQVYHEEDLARKVAEFFNYYGTGYTLNTIKNIVGLLKLVNLPLINKTQAKRLIPFANGVLHKDTKAFTPHQKEYGLTYCYDVEYNPQNTHTPHFDKWIDYISDNNPETREAFLAALYLILENRFDWQYTLELIGEAGGGKGLFLEVGKLLAGEGNHQAIDLDILNDEKARDVIIGKSFLYSPDQAKFIGDAAILKSISAGDTIAFNPKHKKAINARVECVIAICSNTLPIYTNDGGGMERRRVIFPFKKSIDEKDRDPTLLQKISQELGGIVFKLYATFDDPEKARTALQRQRTSKAALSLKEESDHILSFINEMGLELQPAPNKNCLIFGDSRGLPDLNSKLVYERLFWAYTFYCNVIGINKPLPPKMLEKELHIAFKTAGFKIRFSTATIGQRQRFTNITYTNKDATINKFKF